MRTLELLTSLSEAAGVSGYEDEVRALIEADLRRNCDGVKIGKLGSVVASKIGRQDGEPRRRVMLAAHLDEIGLMVTRIESPFLRFTTIGGFDPRVLPGQQVIVHGRVPLHGLIASRPPHVLSPEEREKPPKISDLFVDVDLGGGDIAEYVAVGDVISLHRKVIKLSGDLVSGKSFDNRASIAVLLLAAEMLARVSHIWDVYFVATVQEEVGLRGAITSTYDVMPDIGIAIDVTFGDAPETPAGETIGLGKGPGISIGPNIHPRLYGKIIGTAREAEIPYQVIAEPGDTGTDAWAMQVTRAGVPTALVSIPLRYMHTTVETLSLLDIERAARLLVAFIVSLDQTSSKDLEYAL